MLSLNYFKLYPPCVLYITPLTPQQAHGLTFFPCMQWLKACQPLTAGLLTGNNPSLANSHFIQQHKPKIPLCFWLNVSFKQTLRERTLCFSHLWSCWMENGSSWMLSSNPYLNESIQKCRVSSAAWRGLYYSNLAETEMWAITIGSWTTFTLLSIEITVKAALSWYHTQLQALNHSNPPNLQSFNTAVHRLLQLLLDFTPQTIETECLDCISISWQGACKTEFWGLNIHQKRLPVTHLDRLLIFSDNTKIKWKRNM